MSKTIKLIHVTLKTDDLPSIKERMFFSLDGYYNRSSYVFKNIQSEKEAFVFFESLPKHIGALRERGEPITIEIYVWMIAILGQISGIEWGNIKEAVYLAFKTKHTSFVEISPISSEEMKALEEKTAHSAATTMTDLCSPGSFGKRPFNYIELLSVFIEIIVVLLTNPRPIEDDAYYHFEGSLNE